MKENLKFSQLKEKKDKSWDVFISHASEDKEDFVKPLAETLQKCGVKVWYDDFELKIGDSLSDSINRGLQKSKYGIIIFSPAFFEKQWTDYELKSMLMRQVNGEKVILPIWHNVSKDFIGEKSSYFLDIKALSSDIEWDELICGILQVIRPDIVNSNLMLKMGKELHKIADRLPKEKIPIDDIFIAPIRHKVLPSYLIIATRLISEVFNDILPMDYKDMVTDFARDMDYDREFIIWSVMGISYVTFIRETKCEWDDVGKKTEAFSLMFDYINTEQLKESSDLKKIKEEEYIYLIRLVVSTYNDIIDMVEKLT